MKYDQELAGHEDGIRGIGNSMRLDMAISISFKRDWGSGGVKTTGPIGLVELEFLN